MVVPDPGLPMGPGGMGLPSGPISPMPEQNEVDSVGSVSRQSIAQEVYKAHRLGLQARRQRDLLSEKLLLHIDGSGDLQWADIFEGQRVEIPRFVSEYRKTENVLRLVVDNAVAYHTTMPLRYMAESLPDRKSREKAIVDMLWANFLVQQQDLNGLFAQALYLAMPAGFCPVHGYWREDLDRSFYEPMGPEGDEPDMAGMPLTPGRLDCFVGNPFGTVFDRGAKRDSIHWCSYERVLDAEQVREYFSHVPEARTLEGSTQIPSAAEFQRIVNDWYLSGLGVHGWAGQTHRRGAESDSELMVVIAREDAPTRSNPLGRLRIVAVPGAVDIRRGEGAGDRAVLLADQPLPAGDFSFTNFYSHHRGSDVHGKPWVEDLDQLQVDLNIALSKRWEAVNRMMEAPIVAPGGAIHEDLADLGGYQLMEIEPSMTSWRPKVMEWPTSIVQVLNQEVEDKRRALYTGGGYQASSRGEAPGSRMAYRAIVALQQADNTIHGPVNMRFKRSACDFMRRMWSQMKTYGDVPWLIDRVGDEYAHLAEPFIDKTKLSDQPPHFTLVNSFGPSPELRAQEILELMQMRGADGEPFLRTREARRMYPNPMVFDDQGDPKAVQRRRAKTIAQQFHVIARDYREQYGFDGVDPQHPAVQQLAQRVFMDVERQFPRKRDDDLTAHLNTLSEITQDPTADPIAALAAGMRQELYYQWQAAMASTPLTGPGASPAGGSAGPGGRSGSDPRSVAAEMQGGAGTPGTTLSDTRARPGAASEAA